VYEEGVKYLSDVEIPGDLRFEKAHGVLDQLSS
jgi:hypothetical protein